MNTIWTIYSSRIHREPWHRWTCQVRGVENSRRQGIVYLEIEERSQSTAERMQSRARKLTLERALCRIKTKTRCQTSQGELHRRWVSAAKSPLPLVERLRNRIRWVDRTPIHLVFPKCQTEVELPMWSSGTRMISNLTIMWIWIWSWQIIWRSWWWSEREDSSSSSKCKMSCSAHPLVKYQELTS